jgi:hypothetical protein
MTQSTGQLSRRSLLRRILGAVGTAAILCACQNAASPAIKISQKAVAYQDHPEGDKRCEKCAQFQPPNECKMVAKWAATTPSPQPNGSAAGTDAATTNDGIRISVARSCSPHSVSLNRRRP